MLHAGVTRQCAYWPLRASRIPYNLKRSAFYATLLAALVISRNVSRGHLHWDMPATCCPKLQRRHLLATCEIARE
jgi:hypothetical protein